MRRIWLATLFIATILATIGHFGVWADQTCRFAPSFNTNDIINTKTTRDQFFKAHAKMEARFIKGAGIDKSTFMTFDGQPLDVDSGLPYGSPHLFSAPSKECLHLAVLAQAINGHPIATEVFDNTEEIFTLLKEKAANYEKFNDMYPGFGGFLPWFALDGKGSMTPTWDFQNKVPALDNGEMLWAAFAVAQALREKHPEQMSLIASYDLIWQRMIDNGVTVFYEYPYGFRTVTLLTNQSLPMSQNTYTSTSSPGWLNDPYEGELFTVAMYLFSKDLTPAQKEQLWVAKRPMLQKVDLVLTSLTDKAFKAHNIKIVESNQGQVASSDEVRITVERGFWYSAHEKWKYLFLPYKKAKNNWRVFKNGERARTHYANHVAATGLWASVNGPITENGQNGDYFSDCGIQAIAFNNVTHDFVTTPYGSFPLFLVKDEKDDLEGIAAGWLHHMIVSRQGQNCFGTTESFNISGNAVAPLVTWDSKITTLVAAMEGNVDIVTRGLDRLNVTKAFVDIIDAEWGRLFGDVGNGPLPGEDLPFLPPNLNNAIPNLLNDFTSCSATSPACPDL